MEIFGIHFMQPMLLSLLGLIPVVLFLSYYLEKKQNTQADFLRDINQVSYHRYFFLTLKNILLIGILSCFILLLADPHTPHTQQKITKNGIDIVLALDVSKSMDATDLNPSRIEKAKETIIRFLESQETNRIGLVIFAGKPLSSVPLTFDYSILQESLEALSTDTLNQGVSGLDGTAVGDSLLMSKNLFDSGNKDITQSGSVNKGEKREKVVILLTDGDANRGVEPVVASKLLVEDEIIIYSIGIGSKEGGRIVVNNGYFKQEMQIPPLNSAALKEVASITGGHFFRAGDSATLTEIFTKLEELEKHDIEIDISKTFSENYQPLIQTLLLLLGILLLAEIYLIKT